jgi:hypothetical protein
MGGRLRSGAGDRGAAAEDSQATVGSPATAGRQSFGHLTSAWFQRYLATVLCGFLELFAGVVQGLGPWPDWDITSGRW